MPAAKFQLSDSCVSVCVHGIRKGLWTACMRRCRAPAMAHLRPFPAAPPAAHAAVRAAAPAAQLSCWMTMQSGEALEDPFLW